MKIILGLLFVLSSILVQAQPGGSFLYTNVKIHVGNGQYIENGVLGVKNGKISLIGDNTTKYNAKDYAQVLDGKGQHLYPAFIAPNTQLGLVEVESVRASRDFAEVGMYNPNVRSLIAYNTDSQIIPTIRSNGILISQVVPQGGRISGLSSLLYTAGFNWEDATCKADNGLHLWWPSRYHATGWWAEPGPSRANKNYALDVQAIRTYLEVAKAYYQKEQKPEEKNLKFEAMNGVFRKERKLFVHVDEAKGIIEAIDLLQGYGFEVVVVGGTEAWQVADFLKEKNVPVILGNTHSLPTHTDSDYDQPYRTPALLHEKGVKFCFSVEGSWQQRNLPFHAGHAVGFGLPKEAALSGITKNTADILGIGERLGSLEVGKDATFIVSVGDALDMQTSQITAAYIGGKVQNLDDKHQELNRKFRAKLGLK